MANPDRVQVVKWESPAGGGSQEDTVPTEINPNEDALDAKGLFIQDDSSADDDVLITRNANGDMVLKDKNQAEVALSTLAAGGSLIESKGLFTTEGGVIHTPGTGIEIDFVIRE